MKASIHCIEPIPCNPCETACPFGAITIGEDITALPRLDPELCRGCGICLAVCPGLAIRMIGTGDPGEGTPAGGTSEREMATVALPYEYLPIPEKGEMVRALSMDGTFICDATVLAVKKPLKGDPTRVVYLSLPREQAQDVWALEAAREDPVICRCEEIRRSEIMAAIRAGARTLEGVKRRTRAGMGLCQGQSCGKLISRIIAEETGLLTEDIPPMRKRPPVNPITLGELASGAEDIRSRE